MITKKKLFFLNAFFFLTILLNCKNGISYQLTKGRLGDQMIAYAQTLWFSHIYDLDFFYNPFDHASNFVLHTAHNLVYSKDIEAEFNKIVPITKNTSFDFNDEKTLYFNSLNTKKSPFENLDSIQKIALEYPWFKKLLQQLFTPIFYIQKLNIPKEFISVAVHIRMGSGTDKGCISKPFFNTLEYYNLPEKIIDKSDLKKLFSDEQYPNKFPPYQFYIDQINLLIRLFPNKKFLIYIFTDHKNPIYVANLLSNHIDSKNQCLFKTSLSKREKPLSSVEQDFYWMSQCDFLIRAGSNLSRAAQLFGNHSLVIYIKNARWHEDAVIPDSIGILAYNKNDQSYVELCLVTADMENEKIINTLRKNIAIVLKY